MAFRSVIVLNIIVLAVGLASAKKPTYAQTVCIMQPDHGEACPGKASEEAKAFYFDPLSEKCAPMIYKGCGGNKNTFANTDNCINSCQTPYLVEKEKDQELAKSKKDCALPVGPGLCKAIIPMYYYDQEKGCSKFTYGGCGGNRNQFNTKEECDALCK